MVWFSIILKIYPPLGYLNLGINSHSVDNVLLSIT